MTDLDKVKADLVEWSRENDPEKKELGPDDLWCSLNRLICDHFGTDWLEHEIVTNKVLISGVTQA